MKKSHLFFILCIPVCFLFACGQGGGKKTGVYKNRFQAATIEVDISNKNSLAILMAKDGTINRSGSGVVDSTDKNFFMGLTEEKVFDSLMETVSDDLIAYCRQSSPGCDTTKETCKVTVSFSDGRSDIGFEYCINGTINDLPDPIKKYIANAIRITEPWYQAQKRTMDKK